MKKIILPELGQGIEKAVISRWYCKVGDTIREGDDIVEIVTDKAAFNVPAEDSGILSEILVNEGEELKIGELLATIES
ncbi:MAG: biotin/lipoyl-containing protein [Candidatus Zapsychrus exili]|nr:biotin/lipoyl-containing protein [Candidatus Zapsychrus exili]